METRQLNEQLLEFLQEYPYTPNCVQCGGTIYNENIDNAADGVVWYNAQCQDCGTQYTTVYKYQDETPGEFIEMLDIDGNPLN